MITFFYKIEFSKNLFPSVFNGTLIIYSGFLLEVDYYQKQYKKSEG